MIIRITGMVSRDALGAGAPAAPASRAGRASTGFTCACMTMVYSLAGAARVAPLPADGAPASGNPNIGGAKTGGADGALGAGGSIGGGTKDDSAPGAGVSEPLAGIGGTGGASGGGANA